MGRVTGKIAQLQLCAVFKIAKSMGVVAWINPTTPKSKSYFHCLRCIPCCKKAKSIECTNIKNNMGTLIWPWSPNQNLNFKPIGWKSYQACAQHLRSKTQEHNLQSLQKCTTKHCYWFIKRHRRMNTPHQYVLVSTSVPVMAWWTVGVLGEIPEWFQNE